VSGNGWLHLLRSASGNSRVAPVTGGQAHRPARCHDGGCQRATCYWYRAGLEDGYRDGHHDGYEDGFRAGQAAERK
jgi:hypothetical protein